MTALELIKIYESDNAYLANILSSSTYDEYLTEERVKEIIISNKKEIEYLKK